jgi:hypothetical protein
MLQLKIFGFENEKMGNSIDFLPIFGELFSNNVNELFLQKFDYKICGNHETSIENFSKIFHE